VKAWNGVTLWAARLLLAQARAGLLPSSLGWIHPRFGSPYRAIVCVAAVNVAGVLFGRGALVALLNMTSICVAFTLVLAVSAALRLRSLPDWTAAPYAAPGGRVTLLYGLVGASAMALFAAVDPVLQARSALPTEWLLMAAWAALGGLCWIFIGRHRARSGGTTS
jgi:amino acid transporter